MISRRCANRWSPGGGIIHSGERTDCGSLRLLHLPNSGKPLQPRRTTCLPFPHRQLVKQRCLLGRKLSNKYDYCIRINNTGGFIPQLLPIHTPESVPAKMRKETKQQTGESREEKLG